jgi:long-chain acyl-CoA synthetase
MSSQSNLLRTFLRHVENRGEETAAMVKREGRYTDVSWHEMWVEARKIARGLIALGLLPGDRACIIAATRIEWCTTDLGILAAGGVTVPIYPSNLPDECQYVADHSGCKIIFAEDAAQVAKFREQRDKLPQVRHVVQLDGELEDDEGDGWALSVDELRERGGVDDSVLEAPMASLGPESILTIIYTSGTTGRPKGVVLTHANMLYEGDCVEEVDVVRTTDVQLIFLPLAHVFAKVLEVSWFSVGYVMAFAESMQTIKENLAETRPSIMCGVPRVFEKFYSAVVEQGMAAEGIRKTLFEEALAMSVKNGEAEETGRDLAVVDQLKWKVLRKLVFSKIAAGLLDKLGGRMRIMLSGGAPLSKKINWFFRDAGLTIVEGFGMTESSAGTTINLPHDNQIGTVGPPLPGTELKIAEDGEILIKGPGVMREYWRNPEATAEAIIDGWLQTGDIGELDRRKGSLRITDRKKDIIVTAGGKNVAPQRIEGLLKVDKLVAQAVVHGDRRKFLSALITVDPEQLVAFAKTHRLNGDYASLSQHPRVRSAIQEVVDRSNSELASYESVKKFAILDADLSVETGELTPKLSVKRKVVNAKFGHIFDAFYEDAF